MIDTPYGETSTVEELHKFTQCSRDSAEFLHDADWFDTSKFPVLIRVIERPVDVELTDEGGIKITAPPEIRTFVLESEDIEISDNCIWLLVGDRIEDGDPAPVDPELNT